ncbi:LysR family transcriptional regulator [Pseudomonas fluorescens]|uniref:LysR family transcriptional regulator n=1 Tax=Pseudomonas fluorescens TaxID=294 RepID=UPI00054C3ADD|nr:LysR family transcriptional regulator [Pseudomonas fluorescens]KII27539.1 LysR family transcriptional regulator [Pseudomonas fluorescens]
MNRNDLRHADMNLLVVFETMMRERNVTRAGERLFLGQTTISCALGRLRSMFNDPLFIRTGRTMEPTARADEIHARLAPALDGIAVALSCTRTFDPCTSEGTFHVGLSDDVEYGLLPRLMKHLRDEAPNITLVVRRVDQRQLAHLLTSGEISVGISLAQELPASAHCKSLRPMQPMLLRADSIPGPLTLDDFCKRPHVVVSSMGNVIDDADHALGLIGRQRKVVLAVPQFSALPALLTDSDMVAIVPDYVAQAMVRLEGMRAELAPLDLPTPDLSMAWRGAMHNDPRESWLRSCFCRFLGEQQEQSAA